MAPTQKSETGTHTQKKRHPRFEPLILTWHGQRPTCYPTMFLVYIYRGRYLHARIDAGIFWQKKQKQEDYASTADVAPGRVERDEQGEARRANTTPNGGPHLELGRLRLKTWSKSNFSIAETTWPTCLDYTCIYMDIERQSISIRYDAKKQSRCDFDNK